MIRFAICSYRIVQTVVFFLQWLAQKQLTRVLPTLLVCDFAPMFRFNSCLVLAMMLSVVQSMRNHQDERSIGDATGGPIDRVKCFFHRFGVGQCCKSFCDGEHKHITFWQNNVKLSNCKVTRGMATQRKIMASNGEQYRERQVKLKPDDITSRMEDGDYVCMEECTVSYKSGDEEASESIEVYRAGGDHGKDGKPATCHKWHKGLGFKTAVISGGFLTVAREVYGAVRRSAGGGFDGEFLVNA
eukprot:Skav209576  [mRNA]  locus=scaffold281:220738:223166:+ [translate_table: standard]